MTKIVDFKIGDTFYAECTLKDDDGTSVNLTVAGLTPTSVIRMPNTLDTVDLDVEVLDQGTDPGRFNLSGDTSDWEPGLATWDIQYSSGDVISSTETVKLRFKRDLTP